ALLPPQGDVLDEWEFYWEIARRLGTEILTAGGSLPMDRKPSKFEVLEKITHGCRVPLARVREMTREGGRIFSEAELRVEPSDPDATGRLQLVPDGVLTQIREMRAETLDAQGRVV